MNLTRYTRSAPRGKPGNALLLGVLLGIAPGTVPAEDAAPPVIEPGPGQAAATFAGGCFWCMEADLEKLPGVRAVISGYSGGHLENPTYKEVSAGNTGHREVVRVLYDPAKIGYDKLLRVFWRNIDPTDGGGQFCDRGFQYSSAIFHHDTQQQRAAELSLREVSDRHPELGDLRTPILPAGPFYPAEDRHQDYYARNPFRYRYYRFSCGRDQRLEKLWGPPREKS